MASSKRERELARMRAERQAARRAAAVARRRRQRNTALVALAAVAVVAVVVGAALVTRGGRKTDALTSSSAPTATSPAPTGCRYPAGGKASKRVTGTPPAAGIHATVPVVLTTNRGEVDLSLDGGKAPCTVGSFGFLAGQAYFDGTSCHRLTTAGIFVLQCGDPSGTGSGGPGYAFADENLTGATYPRGTVAMANAGPGTNGSQFFLVYKATQLDPKYTPFGTITKGLDLLEKVAAGGSTPTGDGKPKIPLVLKKVSARLS